MKKLLSLFVILIVTGAAWANNVITYTASKKLEETTEDWGTGLHTNAFNVSIYSHTFSNGTGTITFSGDILYIGYHAFYLCSDLMSIAIPDSITSIGDKALFGCTGLTSITIPNSVTNIGNSAFGDCYNLTSITIPNSVTNIGEAAFGGCSGLTSVTIPNSVTNIGFEAFGMVANISYSGPVAGSPWGAKCANGFVDGYFVYSDASKTNLCGCSSAAADEIVIPNSVTNIGDEAFCTCSKLVSVTIPNSVTSIGNGAFSWCTSLISVTIGNSVTSIGDGAFSLSSLESITIGNSVTNIGENAFEFCGNLKTVYNASHLNIVKGATTYGYVAYYADNVYTSCRIVVNSSDYQLGTTSVALNGTTFPNDTTLWSETEVTITATPATGFQFNGWSDGNTDNTRVVTLTKDTSIVANFGTKMCTLTIISNIEEAADITGAGTYEYGTSVSCAVDVMTDYTFIKWGNGKTANPYKFKIYDDMTLYAFFEEDGGEPIAPSEMIVTPADDNANLQWPQVDNANSYTMTITKGGETICSLTFNGLGQLINIDFSAAPARAAASAKVASATTGFNFTVTGLDSGTTYGYLIEARDEKGEVISTEEGTFTTTGEATSIDETTVNKYVNTATKFLRNGQLLILRDGKTYNMQGAVVE